ncbi:hypothetical protein [Bacteroides thetaiotaomicron]|nr:hypothetical protein [Bacteroides thetaiotaomicron]
MKRIFLFMLPMAFSMGAQAYNVNIADTVHIPEHTRSHSGSL